ncbi:PurA ssDNA and RNA-binding protein [Trichinella nativa]|uniref:PurA ssDNA and RNA-binding protein n=3 Tax=Trichinella TaxID=6333 RepID=A0A1Y3ETB6_9BILA|nr:Transcriptional activator protein Pur-alpha [Trichinella murrelli]KRY54423.1 Transcriptional activator protein Pur-alpha [Trichinella britovi]OUC48412.1 PurA ssDNA and RNA-binding protein [Trichinella nativa]
MTSEAPPTFGEEQELASRMLQIQSKRFYLDVKENERGRFIKIAEVGAGGRKSRLLMSMAAASEFRSRLAKMDEYYQSLCEADSTLASENGLLKSDIIFQSTRRYYLDLKENARGKFLRVTQVMRRPAPRSQIAIPAQGMAKLVETLDDLLKNYMMKLPQGLRVHMDNKVFYCDVRQNARGVFMRISEVRPDMRSSILIPEKGFVSFRNYFIDVCEELAKDAVKNSLPEGDNAVESDKEGGAASKTIASSSA